MHHFKEAIKKCIEFHKGFYDYSSVVEPKRSIDKVEIICPKHGVFEQSLNNHLSKGETCPKCAIEKKKKIKFSNSEMKERFINKYGKKYSYDNFIYYGYK